jgi:DNA repair exonuclease SbcCD ATPase subunit
LARFSEVDQKNSKLEKEKEADAKRIADLEYALSVKVELHKSEVTELDKNLDEVTKNCNVEQSKREIFDTEQSKVQKKIEELRQAKEECYVVAMHYSTKLKYAFTSVGAFSIERNFIRGDREGVIKLIEGEIEAFDEVLTDRGIFVPM